MNKKNIFAKSEKSDEYLRDLYKQIKKEMEIENQDLDNIFEVVMLDREKLFPNQNQNTEKECLRRWINNYIKSIDKEKLPSSYVGKPKKMCSDPAVSTIVRAACGLDDDKIAEMEVAHNLFMSAENIQGGLLEEYIANNIKKYGWIWCLGNTLQAVDFCKMNYAKSAELLQVKNKNNTENSSSGKIRVGTEIQKWNRLKTRSKKNKPYPAYEWNILNAIINTNLREDEEPCNMSEEDYQQFLKKIAEKNKDIITKD